MRYAAFSDESSHNQGRFRAIASVSLPVEQVPSLSELIRRILTRSQVSEFKWVKLKGARERYCAVALIDLVLESIVLRDVRVDTLVWDTHDARHAIPNRDDRANYERMFFHLHRGLMSRREPEAEWWLHPDERTDLDWSTTSDCLGHVGRWRKHLSQNLLFDQIPECFFHIVELQEVESTREPIVQAADLFAGLARSSREDSGAFGEWQAATGPQETLFGGNTRSFSRRAHERFTVIEHLDQKCKNQRLGVSLKTRGYLNTPRPRNPLNFWHYTPQHVLDRAPTRED